MPRTLVMLIPICRGNCQIGLYCDSQSLVCMQTKQLGESCDADKEYVLTSMWDMQHLMTGYPGVQLSTAVVVGSVERVPTRQNNLGSGCIL